MGVLFGQPDGTFAPVVIYSAGGSYTNSVVIGDIDGDGIPDLVVANAYSPTVGVLAGPAGRDIRAPGDLPLRRRGLRSVTIGSLNDDPYPDLVVTNAGSNNVSVLLGQPGGTFLPASTYGTGGSEPVAAAIADFDGDGRPDLVVANSGDYGSTPNLAILFAQPDGTFGPAVVYATGGSVPRSVVVRDLNADGQPDLVVANSGSNNVGVLFGQSGGTFAPR